MFIIKFSCLGLAIAITERLFCTSHFSFGYILSYLVSPLLCLLLCEVFFILMKTFVPHFLNILTGGRD